ncbi:unnamed protein product (macronuclear) [Paramecium tetraurelia]|uniref:Uncharacterized protein n=1 Tax=Paramecium tetraurelia TaxID=5888 RepID=A0BXJ1_PARTE|nr:uncharacterized protein GSPATT00033111001 [Paramecium tetraurelia]CAK63258.1 unnamed protein product [Paramecium tetraurelia]|eukprot:XP_001430656.1 hypothetical protein (macronuclear) [Paramecium tetraurelia strain d4-2]
MFNNMNKQLGGSIKALIIGFAQDQMSIQEALGDDLQAYNNEIKNKLFSQDLRNQPQQTLEIVKLNYVSMNNLWSIWLKFLKKILLQSQKKVNRANLKLSLKSEKQLFFSKQGPSVNNQQGGSKFNYQL